MFKLDGTHTGVQSPPQNRLFEFSGGGGGGGTLPTQLQTLSPNLVFLNWGGGGVLCQPYLSHLRSEVSDNFHFQEEGGGGGGVLWSELQSRGYFRDFEQKSEPLQKAVAPQIAVAKAKNLSFES